jgi:hypothetical protein
MAKADAKPASPHALKGRRLAAGHVLSGEPRLHPPDRQGQQRQGQGEEDGTFDALEQLEAISRLVEIEELYSVVMQARREAACRAFRRVAAEAHSLRRSDGMPRAVEVGEAVDVKI